MCNSNHARSLWSLLFEMEERDRFPELSESELTSLLDQKNSDNTKKATKSCFKRIHRSQSSIRSYASQTRLSTTQEEDVRNIRIVEQQEDRNNHCGNLFGWP